MSIEAVSFRERALLTVQNAVALSQSIGEAVQGEVKRWARVEKEFTHTLETLRQPDRDWRTAQTGEVYAALVDGSDGTLAQLLLQTDEYLKAVAGTLQCVHSGDPKFADRGQALMDRLAHFEMRARIQK